MTRYDRAAADPGVPRFHDASSEMTVQQSPVAALVGRERNSAQCIADPAGLAASEHGGVTRNGERQVGIEVTGLTRTSGSPLNVLIYTEAIICTHTVSLAVSGTQRPKRHGEIQ